MPTIEDDDKDATPKGLVLRLERTVELMQQVNMRLQGIKGVLADPPEPDRPALINALNKVKAEIALSNRLADEMIRIVRS